MSHATTEHYQQADVCHFCALHGWRVFAIPNGAHLYGGFRSWRRLQAEGASAGVPDLMLPYARGGYHGLFIEMKKAGGEVSAEQQGWLDFLAQQGYLATVCYSAEDAIETVTEYMEFTNGA